jgi:hypothetical protein
LTDPCHRIAYAAVCQLTSTGEARHRGRRKWLPAWANTASGRSPRRSA